MSLRESLFRFVRHENHFWRGSGSLFFQDSVVAVFLIKLFLHDLKVSTWPFSFCLLNFAFRVANATNKSLAQCTIEFTVTCKKFLDLFSTNKMMTVAVFFSNLLYCAAHAGGRKMLFRVHLRANPFWVTFNKQMRTSLQSTWRMHLRGSISSQKLDFCMEAIKERVRYNMHRT